MQVVAEFKLERSTPGTHRYKHDSGDTGVETIYIRKDAFGGGPAPIRIQLMITPTQEET